jgi:hypothetical protein
MNVLSTASALVLATVLLFSGCLGSGEPAADEGSTSGDSTADGPGPYGNGTAGDSDDEAAAPPELVVIVLLDGNATEPSNGSYAATVGANLTFDASASTGDNLTFAWNLGDGNISTEAAVNHHYAAAGNYTVNVTATDAAGQTATSAVNVTVSDGAALPAEPIQTVFEYEGEFLGCEPSATETCISRELGPDEDPIDGVWVPLDERYWGLDFTGGASQPVVFSDTDCWFVSADMENIGSANNGENPCTGTVPDGAAWIFLYPYAQPATAMSIQFAA